MAETGTACRSDSETWRSGCVGGTRRFTEDEPRGAFRVGPPAALELLLLGPSLIQPSERIRRQSSTGWQNHVNPERTAPVLKVVDHLCSLARRHPSQDLGVQNDDVETSKKTHEGRQRLIQLSDEAFEH